MLELQRHNIPFSRYRHLTLCICCILILQHSYRYKQKMYNYQVIICGIQKYVHTKASRLPKFSAEHSVTFRSPIMFILKCRVRNASHDVLSHFENLLQSPFLTSYSSSTGNLLKDPSHWIIFKLISPEKYEVSVHTKRCVFCQQHANIFL